MDELTIDRRPEPIPCFTLQTICVPIESMQLGFNIMTKF